jgi:desumoylating isopeptidase 1
MCGMEHSESPIRLIKDKAYDLWTHNCNNFSNDFATFLLGKGIPDHITNLPQQVLNSPFGRVLQPHVNQMVERQQRKNGGLIGIESSVEAPKTQHQLALSVRVVITMVELDKLLKEAEKSCAVIFFTSSSCAPCKRLYPMYDELAVQFAHKITLILVDVSRAYDIGAKYSIRATPTFMTFLHGAEENRWTSSDPSSLRSKINLLVQMAWPPHSHEALSLPALRSVNTKPVLFSKIPPLGKLKAKMGPAGDDAAVAAVMHFVSARADDGAAETTLPDLEAFSKFLQNASTRLPAEIMFTIVDLMRVALIDPRFSGWYAEEKDHKTVAPLISYVNSLTDCPYSLRLVALQMACNLFTTPLYPIHILKCPKLNESIVQLITTSLLDDKHHNVRVAAASLVFNIATANSKLRTEEHLESLPEGQQVELAASLLEAIGVEEESPEALKGFLLAFGYLVYCAPKDGELVDLLKSMDARGTVIAKRELFPGEALVKDIGDVLLGKGLE